MEYKQEQEQQNYKYREFKNLISVNIIYLSNSAIRFNRLEQDERLYVIENFDNGEILVCKYYLNDNEYKKVFEFNKSDLLHIQYLYDDDDNLSRLNFTLRI